jgi:Zn-dependent peptidase ImmA (M78 family)
MRWLARPGDKSLEERIEAIASYFKVSEEVVARRLLHHRVIQDFDYEQLRTPYRKRWLAHDAEEERRQRESRGGPLYYVRKVYANGRKLTQTVLETCSSEQARCERLLRLYDERGVRRAFLHTDRLQHWSRDTLHHGETHS